MGSGPSRTTTVQAPTIPPETARLINLGTAGTQAGLEKAPITSFQDPNIETIVGVDPAVTDALKYYQDLVGGSATPGVLDAFKKLQLPLIQQEAGLAGLGRSGALLDAEAIGQASSIMDALKLQSGAATDEALLGEYLTELSQAKASAPYTDFLRRQGITESLLSGATGLIPSTIGQRGSQKTTNAGLLGYLFGYNV